MKEHTHNHKTGDGSHQKLSSVAVRLHAGYLVTLASARQTCLGLHEEGEGGRTRRISQWTGLGCGGVVLTTVDGFVDVCGCVRDE